MNAFSTHKFAACEVRQKYPEFWETDLSTALGAAPGFCLYASLCSCCASYGLRKRALYGDMSRYICFGGMLPCSGRCGEQKCPAFCLGVETACCFAQSVVATRWMIQDEMHLKSTKCDNCIVATMVAAQYLACIVSCVAMCVDVPGLRETAHALDLAADIAWCSVCACMQTQHKVQLDARDAGRAHAKPVDPMLAPHLQAMGIPVGPPPQAGGGYAQPQNYVPQAYPPPPAYAKT